MIDAALIFLVKSFNDWLLARTGGSFGKAEAGRIVDDTGKWSSTVDQLGAAVINIEEERVLKSHLPEARYVSGRAVTLPPDVKLNLHVLFAARFTAYEQGLRSLSHLITFFQAHPAFTASDHPDLDPRIEKLVVEMQSLSYEQLNQMWAFVGGKQLPAVVYKVRMVVLQDQAPTAVGAPVTEINVESHGT